MNIDEGGPRVLINCPECKREVSASAETCPWCGFRIIPKKEQKIVVKQKKSGCGCLPVLLLLVLIPIVAAIFNGGGQKPKPVDAAAEQRKKAEDEKCRQDIQCWGDRNSSTAAVYCPQNIERLAKYSAKWTDGVLEPKFSRFRWLDKGKGTITYIGDKVQFQNGFGAFQNMVYECDIDPVREVVLDVRAIPGKM